MSLITQLKILKLSKIKPNFSKLAREYEIDRRTVKKYYDGYEGKPAHRNKASKLDKHKQLIAQKLQIKGANVKAVYEFIVDEVDENIGTYSNFNKYVVANNLRPKTAAKGHPRYETAPGIQAQVDWKEDIKIANCYGEIFTFQVFDYKLGYSRYPIFTYKLYKTRQESSVVDRDGNRRNISNRMKAFAKDFNFKIKLCKPRHPFTKGKVEVLNKFLAWIYPYEGEFETEEELIAILEKINAKVIRRTCDETGVPPLLLFQKEKEYLQSLPSKEVIESYLNCDRQTIVRKDSMVTFMKCKYSVPAEYIEKPVRLCVINDQLEIYYSTELIAKHRLSDKKLNYKTSHYKQLLSGCIEDNATIDELAESNLRQLDQLL